MSGTATGAARQRATAFAQAHGSELERARAAALVGAARADAALALLPTPDPQDAAGLCRTLEVCDELRALRSPLASQAGAAVAALQASDGGFGAEDQPLQERLCLCGRLGGILARSPFARPELLDAAGSFLARHFSPDLLQGAQWESIAAYALYFSNALHEASDEILQWCGRELERGFRSRAFDALRTARVLVLCDAHALPGARLSREELLLDLFGLQAPDGSFGDAPEPALRVETTLQGLHTLGFLDESGRLR